VSKSYLFTAAIASMAATLLLIFHSENTNYQILDPSDLHGRIHSFGNDLVGIDI